MLITLRIWWWNVIENSVWYTGGARVCLLRQKRWSIRLAKDREKVLITEQRKSLTTWRDLVLLYRVITKRLITNMVVW